MLWEHQKQLANKSAEILKALHIVYLSVEMRVGKTLTALETAKLLNMKNVLFVTKLKARQSVLNDYSREGYKFRLTVTNYEQLHKYQPEYDLIIADEAHGLSGYPKPSIRTKELKRLTGSNYLILLSGTPSPESYSQLFHQFWVSAWSPFKDFKNFYTWSKVYINVKQQIINSQRFNNYDDAKKEDIMKVLQPYFISFTQSEAGFRQTEIDEELIEIPINPNIHILAKILLKDRYYRFRDGTEIVCDTAVKLQQKLHQIYSGTVKFDGGSKILDTSKADYIRQKLSGQKIAIYYKFIAEGQALKKAFPNWTDEPEKFNQSDNLIFLSQIQSGAMGINIASANMLIFYNIDFSFTNYWQARNRIQSLNRETTPKVIWLFAEGGIERKIYNMVIKKKDYTTYYFKRDFLTITKEKQVA